MFRKEGSERTPRDNRMLSGYLCTIAGAVNSAGFVLLGVFTSHVTGNIGRMADDVSLGKPDAAALAAVMVTTFFLGAFGASMLVESRVLGNMSSTSAALLLIEALLISAFILTAAHVVNAGPRTKDLEALLLCAAMGLQNSLVTRLSGAVVRTTHLTGVVTDMAIELARWFRHWRSSRGLVLNQAERTHTPPQREKIVLLANMLAAFVVGSAVSAALAVRFGYLALAPVVAALVIGAVYTIMKERSVITRADRGRARMDSEVDR